MQRASYTFVAYTWFMQVIQSWVVVRGTAFVTQRSEGGSSGLEEWKRGERTVTLPHGVLVQHVRYGHQPSARRERHRGQRDEDGHVVGWSNTRVKIK